MGDLGEASTTKSIEKKGRRGPGQQLGGEREVGNIKGESMELGRLKLS